MSEFDKHPKNKIMSRILEIRYTDLELEQSLCRDLLTWAENEEDLYAHAFALTYLGDYAVAMNEIGEASDLLFRAKTIVDLKERNWDELMLRICSLLAICYEVQADEQSSIQYYMDGIRLAKKIGDISVEALIYNNLGCAFQRHHSHELAMDYFKKAHALLKGRKGEAIQPIVYSNLAEMLLTVGKPEEALEYILLCSENLEGFPQEKVQHETRNWCYYYAAIGNEKKTLEMANRFMKQMQGPDAQRYAIFENYGTLFGCMMKIGNQGYAKYFLETLERIGKTGGLDRLWSLEEKQMQYSLQFEPPEKHPEAYRRFYKKTRELQSRRDKTIVDALKAKISLEEAIQQKKKMQTEQETLEKQVNVDELAQIYNRRFLEKLLREWAAKEEKGSLGIIMLDIDYFKEYNDFYGHLEGDAVIRIIGDCLKRNAVEGIYPCRYGGDEFTCFCDGLTARQVEGYIRGVQSDLARENIPHEKSLCSKRITLSIGYGLEEYGAEPYDLLELADQALYTAKLSGRNTFSRKRVGGV